MFQILKQMLMLDKDNQSWWSCQPGGRVVGMVTQLCEHSQIDAIGATTRNLFDSLWPWLQSQGHMTARSEVKFS